MADEDPYNFEIAIPAVAAGAQTIAPSFGRYGASRSGDDGSSDGGSDGGSDDGSSDGEHGDASGGGENGSMDLSDLDDIDSEDDEDDDSDARASVRQRSAAASRPVAVTAVDAGGGDALDKARSFLSKYSSRAAESRAATAVTRRRVELSMDDDDELSLDASRGADEVSEPASERERETPRYAAAESPVESPVVNQLAATVAAQVVVTPAQEAPDDSGEDSDAPPPYAAPSAAAGALVRAADGEKEEEEEEEEEQSIATDSGASESAVVESLELPGMTPPARAATAEQSAPSESGAYEEEAFDEESVPASPCVRSAPQPAATAAAEPAFDYSMDFSEDGEASEPASVDPPAVNPPVVDPPIADRPTEVSIVEPEAPASDAESEHESQGEQSALLESDDDGASALDRAESPPAASDGEPEYSDDLEASSDESAAAERDDEASGRRDSASETDAQRQDATEETPQPAACRATGRSASDASGGEGSAASRESPSPSPSPSAPPPTREASVDRDARPETSSRPRVVIVRAYESPRAGKPETRDASTQCTGNHAGVQTELVPDGMLNLQEPPRRASGGPTARADTDERCSCSNPPPAPSMSPARSALGPAADALPRPPYSLSMLQQPLAMPTALYKQQLLALQEQIQQKKREAQRLASERASFQYTSLRGAERFIAGRRPPKLALWEALMRVDPTLDEEKAKEAARLAHGAGSARSYCS